jgi:hypothetical protein
MIEVGGESRQFNILLKKHSTNQQDERRPITIRLQLSALYEEETVGRSE